MAKKKPPKSWLSRDDKKNSDYELWPAEPKKNKQGSFYIGGSTGLRYGYFCSNLWEKEYPNITLKPGQCKQVEIPIKFCKKEKK